MSFNKNLTDYRKRKGLSQEQLAFQIGVSRQAVSKWETGLSQPELTNIEKICEVLEITPNDLMGYDFWEVKTEHKKKHYVLLLFVLCICMGIGLFIHFSNSNSNQYHNFYANEVKMYIQNTEEEYKHYALSFYPSISNKEFDCTIIVEYDDGKKENFIANYEEGKFVSQIKLHRYQDAMLYAQIKYENIIFFTPLMKVWAIKEEGQ